MNENRIKLRGGLTQTVSSAWIRDDGSLVVELYDFSEDAHNHLGNDVAFLMIVSVRDKQHLLARLLKERGASDEASYRDEFLLRVLQEEFVDYYAVQRWLGQQGIAYEKEFDSWA